MTGVKDLSRLRLYQNRDQHHIEWVSSVLETTTAVFEIHTSNVDEQKD